MYQLERLTKEEYEAAMKAINEVREERAKQAQLSAASHVLDQGVDMMLQLVGLEETKRLLRKKNHELREM